VTVLSSLRQWHHRDASRKNMRKNQGAVAITPAAWQFGGVLIGMGALSDFKGRHFRGEVVLWAAVVLVQIALCRSWHEAM
jgi:hypothetical protein